MRSLSTCIALFVFVAAGSHAEPPYAGPDWATKTVTAMLRSNVAAHVAFAAEMVGNRNEDALLPHFGPLARNWRENEQVINAIAGALSTRAGEEHARLAVPLLKELLTANPSNDAVWDAASEYARWTTDLTPTLLTLGERTDRGVPDGIRYTSADVDRALAYVKEGRWVSFGSVPERDAERVLARIATIADADERRTSTLRFFEANPHARHLITRQFRDEVLHDARSYVPGESGNRSWEQWEPAWSDLNILARIDVETRERVAAMLREPKFEKAAARVLADTSLVTDELLLRFLRSKDPEDRTVGAQIVFSRMRASPAVARALVDEGRSPSTGLRSAVRERLITILEGSTVPNTREELRKALAERDHDLRTHLGLIAAYARSGGEGDFVAGELIQTMAAATEGGAYQPGVLREMAFLPLDRVRETASEEKRLRLSRALVPYLTEQPLLAVALAQLHPISFADALLMFEDEARDSADTDGDAALAFASALDPDVLLATNWVRAKRHTWKGASPETRRALLRVCTRIVREGKDVPKLRVDALRQTYVLFNETEWTKEDVPLLGSVQEVLAASESPEEQRAAQMIEQKRAELVGKPYAARVLATSGWAIGGHLLFWSLLIALYPRSPAVRAEFFWNATVRRIASLGYVQVLLRSIPALRRLLLRPFREQLVADTATGEFNSSTYFPDQMVRIGGHEVPLRDALSGKRNRCLIVAESGMGKTMFLRHRIAANDGRDSVFLRAARCENGVLPAIASMVEGLVQQDDAFLKALIYRGALDVYIDGLNEVSPDTRGMIAAFVEQFPACNVVLTMQPLRWNAPNSVTVMELLPLQQKAIEAFLLQQMGDDAASRERCLRFSSDLARRWDGLTDTEREILSNPVDLSVIAQLLAKGREPELLHLQQQRYEELDAIYRRNNAGEPFPRAVFSDLAYDVLQRDDRRITTDRMEALAALLDMKMVTFRKTAAEGKSSDEWRFRHDTVIEFFAVTCFLRTRGGDAHALWQKHIGDPRFRGVFLLLAVMLDDHSVAQLDRFIRHYAATHSDHSLSDPFFLRMNRRTSPPAG